VLTVTLEHIDTTIGGPYAGYNWELLYHLPVAVAVPEQRRRTGTTWFSTRPTPTLIIPAPRRCWTLFVFNGAVPVTSIQWLLALFDSTDPTQA
jgi:hypothetical protein